MNKEKQFKEKCIAAHVEHCGKWASSALVKFDNKDQLNTYYAKGVGVVCNAITNKEIDYRECTSAGRNIGVISNATAILGLGDIGCQAGLSVMEAKAVLISQLSGLSATPLMIDEKDPDKFIAIVMAMKDNFAGIHLEDIKAPECFYIESELKKRLSIPVYHDDQHGTAIAVLSGVINALKAINKRKENLVVVVNGVGAAGHAIIKLLQYYGIEKIIAVEKNGILKRNYHYDNQYWNAIANSTIGDCIKGNDLSDAIKGSDLFIGVSAKNILTVKNVNSMNDNPVVFALANPFPEINQAAIDQTKCKIYATGSSETQNQINNVLVFPGLFKGLVASKTSNITMAKFVKIAQAIASCVTEDEIKNNIIVPNNLSKIVVERICEVLVSDKNV